MTAPRSHHDVLDVAIVGAGLAGIHMLRMARDRGMRAAILEAGSGVGGTWFWNRYPGARCDFESFDYSYFDDELQGDWRWSEKYPSQPELLRYIEHVVDRFDLARDIRLGHRVRSARWDAGAGRWDLVAEGPAGAVDLRARHVVLATGSLSEPLVPDFPGLADFAGDVLMTARWPEDADLDGKRIALVGTGSSGVQVMHELAAKASELHVLQRTPGFVVQARNRSLEDAEHDAFVGDRAAYRERALRGFLGVHGELAGMSAKEADPEEREAAFRQRWEAGGAGLLGTYADLLVDRESNDTLVDFMHRRIADIVDDPDTADALTPRGYPIGGKRIVVGTDYYETYNSPHVHLVDLKRRPLERFTAGGVVVGGEELPLDTLVLATGFDSVSGAFLAIDIEGRDGLTLQQAWSEGPRTYLGVHVAGFPNLYLITGPGSPSVFANLIRAMEQHVAWIGGLWREMDERGADTVEAEVDAQDAWTRTVQELADGTLMPSVDSAYMGANVPGKPRVFLMYAGGVPAYDAELGRVAADGYRGLVLTAAPAELAETTRAG